MRQPFYNRSLNLKGMELFNDKKNTIEKGLTRSEDDVIIILVKITIIKIKERGEAMQATKYSRQREAVKEYLKGTYSHPTADEVYQEIRSIYSNISLGTVYRNLNLLVEQGEAIKLTTEGGKDHFDGNPMQHYHLFCERCGRVSDIAMEPMQQLNTLAKVGYAGTIRSHSLLFLGECESCCKQNVG